MIKIYGDSRSGNCYKIKLILSLRGIDCDWHEMNIQAGDTRTDSFLSLNPKGKVPTVILDDGRELDESNAILGYFAEGTSLLPHDPYLKAKVYQWLFFEQYSHEPYIAVARFIQVYLDMPESRRDEYLSLQKGGNEALQIMEQQLSKTLYLVGDMLTIADLSLYAYTHVADQGGFDLGLYPHICRWCERVKTLPCYVPMG